MADVDLLVQEKSVTTTIDLLFQTGWQPMPAVDRLQLINTIVPRFHSWAFFRADVQVDLHWQPVHRDVGDLGVQHIWKRSIIARIGNLVTNVPCPEDQLLLALIHGIRPQVNRRVQWIVDSLCILKNTTRGFDWGLFAHNVKHSLLLHHMSDMLGYLRTTFDTVTPIADTTSAFAVFFCHHEYQGMFVREENRQMIQRFSGLTLKHYRNFRNKRITELVNGAVRTGSGSVMATIQASSRRIHVISHKHPALHSILIRITNNYGKNSEPDWPVHYLPSDGLVRFKSIGPGFLYAVSGWSIPEESHQWSDGWESRLLFKVPQDSNSALRIELDFHAFIPAEKDFSRIDVTINSRSHARLVFTRDHNTGPHGFIVSEEEISHPHGYVDILFTYLDPGTPEAAPDATDTRLLGACLKHLKIVRADLWDARRLLQFANGRAEAKYLEYGWHPLHSNGVLSAMSRASVRIPLASGNSIRSIVLFFTTYSPRATGIWIDIEVGGNYTGHTCLHSDSGKAHRLKLAVDSNEQPNSDNIIEIVFLVKNNVSAGDGTIAGDVCGGVLLDAIDCTDFQ